MSLFTAPSSGAEWIVAGLGNPEAKYEGTRHNAGFAALDALAERWGCTLNKSKWQGLYGMAEVDGRKVLLLKPLTYMNLSGQSIAPAAQFYKIPRSHVLVLCDDITQEPGHLRIRANGSAGGHNRAQKHHCVFGRRGLPPACASASEPSPTRTMTWPPGCWPSSRRTPPKAVADRRDDIEAACRLILAGKLGEAQNKFNH